jgi:hypothetical protein
MTSRDKRSRNAGRRREDDRSSACDSGIDRTCSPEPNSLRLDCGEPWSDRRLTERCNKSSLRAHPTTRIAPKISQGTSRQVPCSSPFRSEA